MQYVFLEAARRKNNKRMTAFITSQDSVVNVAQSDAVWRHRY
jgi:hypothetical protein